MDLKKLRTVHLYLGCIFTPVLLFFVVSGALQTFEWQESRKDGYQAPLAAKISAEVHMHQRFHGGEGAQKSKGFKVFVVLTALGFIVTSVLGVVMALRFASPQAVWGCLFAGAVLPLILLKFFK